MAAAMKQGEGDIFGLVSLKSNKNVRVTGVPVQLILNDDPDTKATAVTDSEGRFEFKHVAPANYSLIVDYSWFNAKGMKEPVQVQPDQATEKNLQLDIPKIHLSLRKREKAESTAETLCHAVVAEPVVAYLEPMNIGTVTWTAPAEASAFECDDGLEMQFRRPGAFLVAARITGAAASSTPQSRADQTASTPSELNLAMVVSVTEAPARRITGDLQVRVPAPCQPMHARRNLVDRDPQSYPRHFLRPLPQVPQSRVAVERTRNYQEPLERRLRELGANLHGTGAYQVLKLATEVFLLLECGVRIDRDYQQQFESGSLTGASSSLRNNSGELAEKLAQYLGCPPQLPYIRRVVEAASLSTNSASPRATRF